MLHVTKLLADLWKVLCTYLILHFTMLIEDLWKFPCTCLDQFKIDHLSFRRINRRSMQISIHISASIIT